MNKPDKLTFSFLGLFVLMALILSFIYFRTLPTNDSPIDEGVPTETSPWVTKNGMRVYYDYAPELPVLDLRLMLDAGSNHDPDEHLGLAELTNAMLDEGTQTHDVDALAEAFAEVGAVFTHDVSRDYAYVGLRTLSERQKRERGVELLKEILKESSFPEEAFNRIKSQQLASIQFKKQKPQVLAKDAFYELLYQGHPYGRVTEGTEETLAKITTKDLKQFFKTQYGLSKATLVLVGNILESEAKAISDELDAILVTRKTASKVLPAPNVPNKQINTKPYASQQTHILMGTLGVQRGDPDFFPLYVGNHILGGDSLSHLFTEVREKQGLAYSVYSALRPGLVEGPFMINLQTKNQSKETALALVEETVRRFVEKGPTGLELTAAKKYITGNFPLAQSSNLNKLSYLSIIGYYQLPDNYLETFNQKVEEVTQEQIKTAFQKRIDLNHLVTVTVGS